MLDYDRHILSCKIVLYLYQNKDKQFTVKALSNAMEIPYNSLKKIIKWRPYMFKLTNVGQANVIKADEEHCTFNSSIKIGEYYSKCQQ